MNFLLVSCSLFHELREVQTTIREEEYSFDAASLPEVISNGESNIFKLLTATPAVTPPDSSPIQWTQADYFAVAQAIHKFAWKDSLKDWNLREMAFTLRCSEIKLGPQGARFEFFRNERFEGEDARSRKDLYITPRENRIKLYETKYQPVYEKWSSIDLSNVKVQVENALLLAEQNGGILFRQEVGDNCSIFASLNADGRYTGWFITYTGLDDQQGKSLWLSIDIRTEKTKKVN
jgi:hypothetical protein